MSGQYTIPNVVAESPRGDRVMDVYSHLLTQRIVYLGTAIDGGVANALIAQLLHLDAAGGGGSSSSSSVSSSSSSSSSFDPPAINLYINCEGGDPPAMLAIYDTIRFIRSPVATTCVGEAVGAGAALLASGAPGRRAALPHSRIVLHQPAAQGRGAIPDLILQADELVRIRSDFEEVLSRHTGQPAAVLRHDTDRDRVFTATAAREYGLVDVVIGAEVPALGA